MINDESVLAIIPARGGSRSVVRKNLRVVGGKPLLDWAIEAAKESRLIDRLVLSSDDPEIVATAKEYGCDAPFVRPAELARDDTPGIEPIMHAMSMLPSFDWVVMLQPTSPLRTASDIDTCIELCASRRANALVSVTEATENPQWMFRCDPDGFLQPIIDNAEIPFRRQDLPEVLLLNGAVYVARCEWLKQSRSFLTAETLGYRMPLERSLDIDTEFDLTQADKLLTRCRHE
jgi:N-acylneuraminate cytidylyltransferase